MTDRERADLIEDLRCLSGLQALQAMQTLIMCGDPGAAKKVLKLAQAGRRAAAWLEGGRNE